MVEFEFDITDIKVGFGFYYERRLHFVDIQIPTIKLSLWFNDQKKVKIK